MAAIDVFRQVLSEGGLPAHVVDAAIANFLWESGGRSDINTSAIGDNGASHGALQAQGSRWSGPNGLRAFAQQRGTHWTDPETQARFVLHELNTSEAPALRALMNTRTPEEALGIWTHDFERAGTPHMEGRLALLQGGVPTAQTPAYGGGRSTAAPMAAPAPQQSFAQRAAEAAQRAADILAQDRAARAQRNSAPVQAPQFAPVQQADARPRAPTVAPPAPPYVNPEQPTLPTWTHPHIPGQQTPIDPRQIPFLQSQGQWPLPTPSWVQGPNYGSNPTNLPPPLLRR